MKLHQLNVARLMALRGLTQADIARIAGWSEAKASRILKGKKGRGITVTDIAELARALGARESEIVDLEDVAQSDEERRMLRDYRAATSKERMIALAAVSRDSE